MKTTLTAERLRELLHYDPLTGIFTRRVKSGPRVKVGDVAGTTHADGGVEIRVDGRSYKANRLAWLYMTGEWPAAQVDHKDGNRANNVFGNLRDVSPTVNQQNRRRTAVDTKTGRMGVMEKGGRFYAYIDVDGRRKWLGGHETADAAHATYLTNKRVLHPGCTI